MILITNLMGILMPGSKLGLWWLQGVGMWWMILRVTYRALTARVPLQRVGGERVSKSRRGWVRCSGGIVCNKNTEQEKTHLGFW